MQASTWTAIVSARCSAHRRLRPTHSMPPAKRACVQAASSQSAQIGVLHWFARLWEIAESDYWGYITNCGTEGNLHGILVGRENLPDGVLYASRETHYSVFKAARMYRMDAVKVGPGLPGVGKSRKLRCTSGPGFRVQPTAARQVQASWQMRLCEQAKCAT